MTVTSRPTRRLVCYAVALAFTGCAAEDDVATYSAAVGAAPVNQLPPAQTIVEDSPLFFSAAGGNALAVSDADNTNLTVQVIVTSGVFTLGHTNNLTVSGNGTFAVTASGTIVDLVAGLDGAHYQPSPDWNGTATLQMNSSDSNGESDLDVLSMTVTPFNDPPVDVVPITVQAATEDVPRAFTLSVTDPDIAGAPLVVSLTASNATLITLPTTTGLGFSVGDGAADTTMTFSGALPDVNAALNGLVVTPPLNYIGASTLVVTSDDQGASGAGQVGSDHDTIQIAWAAVNDPPVSQVPGAQSVVEDASLVLGAASGNAITIADVDASTALVQVTLVAAGGTATLGHVAGIVFTAGDGTADVAMTFNATLANLNAALDGTTFTPSHDFAGAASLTVIANDLGNTGAGGVKQDADTIAIDVTAVNDAPVNQVPGAQATNEDTARVFSAANGNPITVSDADATSLQVTLAASGGTVTLGNRTGLSFQSGDGTADATTTFAGTIASIDAALAGAIFTPTANANGAASLSITTSDLGATGAGGALVDTDTIAIAIAPVNDPPSAINDVLAIAEDAPPTDVLVLGNDTFAPDLGETLTVASVATPLHGAATTDGTRVTYQPAADYNGTDSFAYTIADGSGGTAVATVAVTITSVNDAPRAIDDRVAVIENSSGNVLGLLSNDSAAPDVAEVLTITAITAPAHGAAVIASGGVSVSYTPETGYSGADGFTYTIDDGHGAIASATVSIDVAQVITQPVNTLPGPQTIVEDTPLFFSRVGGNALAVSDANNATLTVQILVGNGTLTLGGTSQLTVSGNGTASVTLSGTIAALVAGLDQSRYLPSPNFAGSTQLTINTSDSNGETDLDVLTLTVTAFNDAPIDNVPSGVQAAIEDSPRTFGTISITDVDIAGADLVVSLVADSGTVATLATTAGLTFLVGDGAADAAMTFRGSLASVNVALNGLTVTAPPNYIGPSSLTITTSDQGATGAGAIGQDTDTIALSWSAVNDPPVDTVPGPQTIAEDTSLRFSDADGTGLAVSDADANAALLQVTLTAAGGTVTLGNPAGVTFTSGDGIADATMTFTGTLAALDASLAGTLYTPSADFAGAGTLTMIANDLGNSGSGGPRQDSDVVAITVSGRNDPPINVVPGPQLTNEDVARVFSSANGNPISTSDPEATSLQVTLTAIGGTVSLGGKNGLTFQAGDGTADALMTFAGTTTSIKTALNGASFAPTPDGNGAAALTISTSDLGASGAGGALTDDDTIAITIVPVNDPPTARNDVLAIAEDAAATDVAVLDNDTFAPDTGELLVVSAVGAPGHGTATTDGTRITYRPAADYNGTDSFSYTLSDGSGTTANATVAVSIASVNDAPGAVDDSFSVIAGSTGNPLAVLSNDTIAPDSGEVLAVAAITAPAHGTATIDAGGARIRYTPAPGYSGADALAYTISDGNGGTDDAPIAIDVEAVITHPVDALPGPQTLVEDSPLVFSAAGGNALSVSDANNTSLTVQMLAATGTFTLGSTSGLTVSGNGTGAVTITGAITAINSGLNNARYNPPANFAGITQLTMASSDTNGESDQDALTVTVTSWNDAPVDAVPSGTQTSTEDTPRTFSTISIADVDLGGASMIVSLTASNGTVISLPTTSGLGFVTGDGTADATMSFAGTLASINAALNGVTVTAPNNYIGPSTLTVSANDQGATGAGPVGQDSDTITLSWLAVNDPPINDVPGPQLTLEEQPVVFSSTLGTALLVGDADAGAAALQVTLTATGGTLDLGDPGSVTFTSGDGIADASMTFRATIPALTAALEGTRYTPNLDVTGAATVTMVTNDLGNTGGAARTDTDAIAITIAPIDDAPVLTVPATLVTSEDVARVMSTAQGNPVRVADVDATALQVSLAGAAGTMTLATRSGLTFQAGDGTADASMTFIGTPTAINTAMNGMTFTPSPNFDGTAGFTIAANDLGATGAGGPLSAQADVAVTVLPSNDPPDAVADALTTYEDAASVSLDVLGNDTIAPDVGESLTVTAVTNPAHGTATIAAGGAAVIYTPAADFNGTDSFVYTVSDGNGASDTATATITITPVNDPPRAVDDNYTVAESAAPTTFTVRSNDSALPDTGETLTIVAVSSPAHGTAAISGGAILYQPTRDYDGTDEFTYTLSDGSATAPARVTVTVTPVDTQPVAAGDTLTVAEDMSGTIAVLANDSGLGDGPMTVTIGSAPAHGAAVVQGDQSIAYAPAADYHGADAFTYVATDADGDHATATVTVTITAVDDTPVAADDALTVVEDEPTELAVTDNDSGLGDRPLRLTIDTPPVHGTATATSDGALTYVPAADYNGSDVLVYTVSDVDGETATATATLTITAVEDAPRATADVASIRPGEAVTIAVLDNDRDPDGDALTVTAVTVPAHGVATIANGAITYTPAVGFSGDDSFDYVVDDGQGGTAIATVTVGVGIDTDGDGLIDLDERETYGTDPARADSDDDLLDDGVEVHVTDTDPLDDDSDDDGLLDGHEDLDGNGDVDTGETSATAADSDRDGLDDGLERGLAAAEGSGSEGFVADADPASTTDPTKADTDGGGKADGVEDANHDGKVEAGETDPDDPTDDTATDGGGDDGGSGGCSTGGGTGGGLLLVLLACGLRPPRGGKRPRRAA